MTTDLAPVTASKLEASAPIQNMGGGLMVRPETARDLMDMAQMMAKSGPMVGAPFRNQPGACLAIMQRAYRVGLDPWALSSKAYLVNGSIAFEAQAIMSMVYASPAVIGRLSFDFEGEDDDRRVVVTGRVNGNIAPCEYRSPRLGELKSGNSPLWKKDPDQQMTYYGARAWARRHVPDVLMGVYTVDEMQDAGMIDVTAKGPDDAKARLNANLRQFESDAATASEPEPIEPPEPMDGLADPKNSRLAEAQAQIDSVMEREDEELSEDAAGYMSDPLPPYDDDPSAQFGENFEPIPDHPNAA